MKIRRALVALLVPLALLAFAPAQTAEPVVVLAAGDIAYCGRTGDEQTAAILDANPVGTVLALGDLAYEDGTAQQFADCYGPSWGRHKARTRPVPGNHDYHTSGAAPYFAYFGAAAGEPGKGYYSYNLGSWHVVALNSEISMSSSSAQVAWLKADLAANPAACTLAYWHKARWSSGYHGSSTSSNALVQALYDAGADVLLVGHDHDYERFAPQNPSSQLDTARGIRQFTVGTGGRLVALKTTAPNSEARSDQALGVLKLELHDGNYSWQFLPAAGATFTDSGSAACVGGTPPPPPSATATRSATPTGIPATPTSTPAPGTPTATPASSIYLPVADARVKESSPTKNYAADPELQFDDGAGERIASYLRFTLPYTPTRAILRLRSTSNASAKGPAVYRADDTWAENTITWANRPLVVGGPFAAFGAVVAGAWTEVDVTSAARAGSFTLALIAQSTDGGAFASRETADKPQLIITP